MRNIKDIMCLGMCFDGYVDLCNKVDYLELLGYKSDLFLRSYKANVFINKYDNYKYIYISLYRNDISISSNFLNYDMLIDISDFKECKGYDLDDNRRYYSDVIERCLAIENMGL